jgi:hypothetical protein
MAQHHPHHGEALTDLLLEQFEPLEGFRVLPRLTTEIPPGRGNMSHGIGPAMKADGDTVYMIGKDMRDVSNGWYCATETE